MYFFLQAGGVSMDVDQMKFENLALVAGAALIAIILVFMYGITLKWGDKEIVIGALKKLLAKKDEDTRLKEELKRFTDDVDNDITNQLYDLVDGMDFRLEKIMVKEHCFFSFGEFIRLVQEELKKRIRRNNLKERMSEESREKYADKILHNIKERYTAFKYKAANVKCGDTYADFNVIEAAVKQEIMGFVSDTISILVSGMRKKIEKYEAAKPEFKTADARKFCCDDCIGKNKRYIEDLIGREAKK
jgi:hypothetical protein